MYRRILWGLLAALVLLPGCGKRLSPEQAQGLQRRIQEARRNTTLEARLRTSVRLKGEMLRADATMQRAPGTVRMKYTSGRFAGWSVIEQDGKVWRLSPEGKPQPSPAGADPAAFGLPRVADLTVSDDGPWLQARRWARRYTVRPPAGGKASLKLTVDVQTSYPLALARYGANGQLLSSTLYQSVNYQAAAPPRLPVPAVASPAQRGQNTRQAKHLTEQEAARALGGHLLKPSYLPAGFALRGIFAHQRQQTQAVELRYFDGLRMLTLIQFKVPERQRAPGLQRSAPGNGRTGRAAGLAQQGRWRELWAQRRGARPSSDRGTLSRNGQQTGANPNVQSGWGRSRLRGNVVRERRGDRIVIVAGELAPEELSKVLASVPYPPGHTAPGVKF